MKKNVKNKIINHILENTKITTTKDINNVLDDLYGNIIQRLLETEMDNHLGYDKNSKEVKETNNRRNGYSSKNKIVKTDKGNNRFWLDVFESIKNRGVKRILFLSIETNKNISRALKISFPDTIIVFPLTDTINQFYKYISSRGKGNIS